jgi:tetratricopeptide (TPR) repeat protein
MTSGFEEQLALEGDSWALALFYWAHSFVSLIRGKQKETRWYNALGWRVGRRLIANGQMPAYWIKHRALTTMMRAHNQWGNYQTSIHFSQRILSLSDHTDHNEDANSIAAVMASLGESHLNLGHYQSAIESFDTCYNLAKKAGDPRLQGEALIGKGLINYELGNFTRASEFVEKVVDIAEQTNDIPRQVNARFLQARIAIIHGAASSILPILNNFLMLARFQQADPYIAKTLILLAETHFSLNQYDQTEVFAQEALEISQNCGLKRDLSAALRVCSQSALQQNNSGNGFRFAQQAVEIAQAIQAPFELGLAIRNRSFFQNQVSTSCQDCEHALNLFNSIGAVFEAGQTQSLLDNLKNG